MSIQTDFLGPVRMDAEFPTFALASTKNFVFVAGGGGSEEYGKKNGILAYRKSKIGKKNNDADDFFKSDDIILQLFVFTEDPNEQLNNVEKLSISSRPAIAERLELSEEDSTSVEKEMTSKSETEVNSKSVKEMTSKSDKEVNSKSDKDTQSIEDIQQIPLKKSLSEPEESEKASRKRNLNMSHGTPTETDVTSKLRSIDSDSNKMIFVIAVGDKKLYALDFNGKFNLRCVSETKIKQVYLNRHLILLRNGIISGFYNFTEQKKPNLKFKIKKFHESQKSLPEEYVYKLYKKNDEVIVLNEHCTEDIPEDWCRFFIVGGAIHKVVKMDGKNTFVFQNNKYDVEGEMSDILVSKDRLAFFSRVSGGCQLYFINHTKKTYDIQHATTMAQIDKITAVSTSEGYVLIYVDGLYTNKYWVADMPISGLSIDLKRIYYCTVTGELGAIPYSPRSRFLWWMMAIIAVIITVMISLLVKYYRKQ